jgi:hypothetical protein
VNSPGTLTAAHIMQIWNVFPAMIINYLLYLARHMAIIEYETNRGDLPWFGKFS